MTTTAQIWPNDELFWLAFQYVAGDMSASAAADFETRLASDQAAREAVAEVVQLGSAIAGGWRVNPAAVGRSRRSSLAWMVRAGGLVVGTAACLVIVVGTNWWRSAHPAGSASSLVQDRTAEAAAGRDGGSFSPEVARAWIETRTLLGPAADDAEVSLAATESPTLTSAGGDGEADANDAAEDVYRTPSWMVVAVEGLLIGDMMHQ